MADRMFCKYDTGARSGKSGKDHPRRNRNTAHADKNFNAGNHMRVDSERMHIAITHCGKCFYTEEIRPQKIIRLHIGNGTWREHIQTGEYQIKNNKNNSERGKK